MPAICPQPEGPERPCPPPDQAPSPALCLLTVLLTGQRPFWEQQVSCHLSSQPHQLFLSYPQLQLSCCLLLQSRQGSGLHRPLRSRTPQLTQLLSWWVFSCLAASCKCHWPLYVL